MVMDGCSWLASCCWVVVLGWQWLWIVQYRFVVFFFFGSEMYYFIIVDILFYCDIHIILLC